MLLALTKYRPGSTLLTGLLHWWTFDQLTGVVVDQVLGGNNLTIQGFGGPGSYTPVAGVVNNASLLSFDSTFQGVAPVDLHSPKDFTIVGVFKPSGQAISATNLGIISQVLPNKNTNIQWYIRMAGNRLGGVVSTDGSTGTLAQDSTTNVGTSSFHTYMFWRDSVNNIIAIAVDSDGSSPHTAVFSGANTLYNPVTGSVSVGGIGSDLFIAGGTFDETGVWNRVLTQAERTFLFNSGAWRTYSDF